MGNKKDVGANLPVVAVGASAGGLEAIKAFISNIAPSSGAAYVFIQHLSPDHHSEMADIASRWTSLTTCEACDGQQIEPNCIYFLPAGTDATLTGNKFVFSPPIQIKGVRYSIDNFFTSLAQQNRPHLAGVIMSGAGNDGAQGALAIKESGGLIVAEDPMLARFNSMPLAAIEIAKADAVLSPELMPEYISNWFKMLKNPYSSFKGYSPETLAEILQLVSVKSHNDFSGYKTTTVKRRIERRMGVCHITDFPSYCELLKKDPQEVMSLANDMLIGVTRFFRDQEAHDIIRTQVIPELFARKEEGQPVRIWVAGCSTGEEAYTMALLAFSYRDEHNLKNPILIFASDIDGDSLEVARAGTYSALATESIPADLLQRYFLPTEAGYKINKDVREAVVFAEHNIITNPPFSRIDLVTCRNLLIYLQTEVQQQLMRVFERIISPGGFLFLGSSESLGALESGYSVISKPWRVFKCLKKAGEHLNTLPALERATLVSSTMGSFANRSFRSPPRERNLRQIVDQFGPMSILINDKNEVLFTTGDLSPFVAMPRGEPNYDLFSLLRPVIRSSIRPLVERVKKEGVRQVLSGVRFEESRSVRLSALPVGQLQTDKYILLTFEEDFDSTIEPHPQREDESWMVIQLEQELQDVREELQRTFELHRCSNEELLAVNEEFIATNEELQSTNEELESSKEELQSLNEELQSTNSVLDAKVQELEHANDDLNNLFSSTDIATLFLNKEFKIKRFTPAMTRLMRLIPADIGRPIIDITHTLQTDNVLEGAEQVLATMAPSESQIKDVLGCSYIKRILPYHAINGAVIGVVMTFTDVTALQAAKEEANSYLARVKQQTQLLDLPLVFARNLNDEIIFWNKGAEEFYGWTQEEALGQVSHTLLRTQFPRPLDVISNIVREKGRWGGELIQKNREGSSLFVSTHWVLAQDANDNPWAILELNADITDLKNIENQLDDSNKRLLLLEFYDPLTQLPNQVSLLDSIRLNIKKAQAQQTKLGLMLIDLDHFKSVNDSLGHDIGNELLKLVSERLSSWITTSRTLARFGGDEFAILLEGLTDTKQLFFHANELQKLFKPPFVVKENELFVECSIGISLYPDDACDTEGLIHCADMALHLAKDEGRGQCAFVSPEINNTAHRQLSIKNCLHRALENNELYMEYQPQVDLITHKMVGVEALLRWQSKTLGKVSPDEFIPVAEKSKLICEIGDWVLQEAVQVLNDWHLQGRSDIRMSVNISSVQIRSETFVNSLQTLLSQYDFSPALLELELTERVLLRDPKQAIALFQSLRDIGVRVSFDDFGTGYCSLQYLRFLRLDHLKVAREFIPIDETDIDNIEISKMIVALAKTLHLECTVEGVEQLSQLRFFETVGCDLVQGYIFSRPVSLSKINEMLDTGGVLNPGSV